MRRRMLAAGMAAAAVATSSLWIPPASAATSPPQAASLSVQILGPAIAAPRSRDANRVVLVSPTADSAFAVVATLSDPTGTLTPDQPLQIAVTLPASVRYQRVGPGSPWRCSPQGTSVACTLAKSGRGQQEPLFLVVRGAGGALGSVSATASRLDAGSEITGQGSLPVQRVSKLPPIVTASPATKAGQTAALRIAALTALDPSDPDITVTGLAPQGADARISAPAFTCSGGECVTDSPLAVGQSVLLGATFDPGRVRSAQWTATVEFTGGTGGGRKASRIPVTLVAGRQPGPKFAVNVHAPSGQSLTPGSRLRLEASVVNAGLVAARPTVTLGAPDGTTLTGRASAWTCRGSASLICEGPLMQPGQREFMPFDLAAASSSIPGARQIRASVSPGGIGGDWRPIHLVDPGDAVPALIALKPERGTWRPWLEGGTRDLPVGQTAEHRLRIVNRGGAPLLAGSTVRVTVPLDGTRSATAALDGGTCSVAGDRATCSVTASRTIPIGGEIGDVVVRFIPSQARDPLPAGTSTATITTGVDRGSTSTTEVALRSYIPESGLTVNAYRVGRLTQGGRGSLDLQVGNEGNSSWRGVTVTGALPRGVQLSTAVRRGGWTCTPGKGSVLCTYGQTLVAGEQSPSLTLPLKVAKNAAAGPDRIRWTVRTQRDIARAASFRTKVSIAPTSRIEARVSPEVAAQLPRDKRSNLVILDARIPRDGSGPWRFRWRQECLGKATADCRGIATEEVPLSGKDRAKASVQLPNRASARKYRFTVIATDGSASIKRVVHVRTVPAARKALSRNRLPDFTRERIAAKVLSTAPNADPPAPGARPTGSSGSGQPSSAAQAASAAPGAGPVTSIAGGPIVTSTAGGTTVLQGNASGAGPVSYQWTQTSGPPVQLANANSDRATFTAPPGDNASRTFQLKTTDATGASTISTVRTKGPSATSSEFCSLYNQALKAQGTLTTVLGSAGGAINAAFNNLSVVGTACANGSFSFSNSTLTLGGFTITNVSGTASASGISMTTGSVSPPSAWGLNALAVDGTGFSIDWTGAQTVSMVGTFSTSSFAFMPLPSGWQATTQVIFTESAAQTSIAVKAQGEEASTSGLVTIAGSVANSGAFQLKGTADNLVTIGGSGIDATGTVSWAGGSSSVSGKFTGQLGSTATLVPGITVPTLSITWQSSGTPSISALGSLAFTVGTSTTQVNVSLNYSGSSDWTMTVTGGGNAAWQILPGSPALTVTPSDFSGTLGYQSGAYDYDIDAEVTQPWSPTSVLTIDSGATFSITSTCPSAISSVIACPTASAYIGLAGLDATVDAAPVDSFSATATAVVGLGSGGGFSMTAGIDGTIDIAPGLELDSATLTTTYQVAAPDPNGAPTVGSTTENGYSVEALGEMTINPVGTLNVTASASNDGWTVAASTSGGISFPGNAQSYGQMVDSIVAYSSFATTVPSPTGGTINMAAGETYVSGTYQSPGWLLSALQVQNLNLTATVEIDPSDGSYSAKLQSQAPMQIYTGSPNSSFSLNNMFLELESQDGNVVVSAGGTSQMQLTSSYGTPAPATMTTSLSYAVNDNTITINFDVVDQDGWQNALGDPGLVLDQLDFSFGWDLDDALPVVALQANGSSLPSDLTTPFGMPQDVPFDIMLDLSATSPCMQVMIGDSAPGSPTVLVIDGGALSASYVNFYVAPGGCVIGTQSYPAGYALDFTGAVFDVGVQVTSTLHFGPTTFTADVTVDSFQLGPLLMDETDISIDFVYGSSDELSFTGGFDLYGTQVSASGNVDYSGGTTTANLDVSTNGFTVDGFTLKNAKTELSVESSPGDVNLDIQGSGDVFVYGDVFNIQEFQFEVANNVVQSASASVTDALTVGPVSISGAFQFQYTESPTTFSVAAAGTLTADSFALGSGQLDINAECAYVSGNLGVPGLLPGASVAGYVIYSGTCQILDPVTNATSSIAGGSNAFCVYADVQQINAGGFSGGGTVNLSNDGDAECTGATTAVGGVSGSINVNLSLGTQSADASVALDGQFQSNGDYFFDGNGTLNVAGIDLQSTVVAANGMAAPAGTTLPAGCTVQNGSDVCVQADANILGTPVTFNGDFLNNNGYPQTTLQTTITLETDGFQMGTSSLTVEQTPSEYATTFDMQLGAGNQGLDTTITFIQGDGTVLFNAYASGNINIPNNPNVVSNFGFTADFGNCGSPCTSEQPLEFSATGQIGFGGQTYSLPPFSISSAGGFSQSSSASASNQSTPQTDVAGTFWYSGNDNWNTYIGVTQNGLSGNASGNGNIYSYIGGYWYGAPCWPDVWDWCSYYQQPSPTTNWGNSGASVGFNPWTFCIEAFGSPLLCL